MRYVQKLMPGIAEPYLPKSAQDKADEMLPTDTAYRRLRLMLFNNEIGPGQKISTTDLAERFQMSPTPIVQALKWMELQGLARHEHNKGYYTEKCTLSEVQEIYELRETIEPALIPHSVSNLNEEKLSYLKSALEAHLESLNQGVLQIRSLTDMEFHFALAALSGKDTHVKFLRDLFDLLYLKYRNRNLFYLPLKSSGPDHIEIYNHVSGRDAKKASAALKRHIGNIKKHVIECLTAYPNNL